MIEVTDLTKISGDTTAVDRVSFQVRPGIITGFLGPNRAGKSTTMRMILGLDRPSGGTALVNGRSFTRSSAPLAEIGALLNARAVDKGRSARNHLRALAATLGIGRGRVEEVLDIVGLTEVAHQSAGSYSLGMGQRLGIASALIADPGVVMLDEPVNGLDPDGIQWIRTLLRSLAAEGRTVFLSSHLMSELDDILNPAQPELVAQQLPDATSHVRAKRLGATGSSTPNAGPISWARRRVGAPDRTA